MCWTEDEKKVFGSYVDSKQIRPPLKLIGEYRFRLGDLFPDITIRLYASFKDEQIYFEQSHFIKTPNQIGPYETSSPSNDNISRALEQVISGFTDHYDTAIKAEHMPDDSWLIPNEKF